MVSNGVLGADDSAFVQSVYYKVALELQSLYELSESQVTQLMSVLETQAMHRVLIRNRECAFHTALNAGQQILQKD